MSNHTYTKKIEGDSIDLFLVFQVERKTVMTTCVGPGVAWCGVKLAGACLGLREVRASWVRADRAKGEQGGRARAGVKRCRTVRCHSWSNLAIAGLDIVSASFSSPREAGAGPWTPEKREERG